MADNDAAMQLEHLQSLHLQSINNSIGRKKRKYDRHSTTSLQDLDLARTPVDELRPHASRRPWARSNLNPLTEDTGACSVQLEMQTDEAEQIAVPNKQLLEQPKKKNHDRWARRVDMKADAQDTDSNAWGSARPSEATRDSNIRDDIFGRLLNKHPAEAHNDYRPVDWSGEWTPPPEEWEQRTKFNNNNDEYKLAFRSWIKDRTNPLLLTNGIEYRKVPHDTLLRYDYIADGIDMVPNTTTVNRANAAKYGFVMHDDPQDGLGKYMNTLRPSELKEIIKLDPADRESRKYESETTEALVKNWLRHKDLAESVNRQRLNAHKAVMTAAPAVPNHLRPSLTPSQVLITASSNSPAVTTGAKALKLTSSASCRASRPQLNIYMRPAGEDDVPELMRIYNWYVQNSPRPCETNAISEDDMGQRLDRCQESKLPFVVAVERKQRGIPRPADEQNGRHKTVCTERLAGFVSVCDFTCQDYVEHISGELELYVDPKHARLGVGRSLLDKAMEVCDNAYQRRHDTPFYHTTELRHLYGPGGARQLHKLIVILRKWKQPRVAALNVRDSNKPRRVGSPSVKTSEDEYELWLRRWLEDCGFELEGMLKGAGAKHGRYIDIAMFGRDLSWTPNEGEVPEPWVGFGSTGNDARATGT